MSNKSVNILFPKDTQEGTQSFLAKWLKHVGEAVFLHEPIAEVSTDKVILEIASPATGILASIKVNENDEIRPGDAIGAIEERSSDLLGEPQIQATNQKTHQEMSDGKSSSENTHSSEISPAVRKLLKEHGVSQTEVRGTGRGGRITTEDIETHVNATSRIKISSRKVSLSPMRKTISKHLTDSLLHTAPHVTTVFECDMSSVMSHKSGLESNGQKVTLTSYFIRALCEALKLVPEVNSRLHEDSLEIFTDVNIGIGTSTPDGGLIVPVLHRAQAMSLGDIARRLQDLTTRARDNSLTREDVTAGTITISNYGVSGSLFATPIIINQPQSSILGVGKLEKRTKVVADRGEDKIEIRPMCYVTLTIDHRVLDGFQANSFMTVFKEWIELKASAEVF